MKFLDARRHSSPILPGFDDDHVTRSLIAIVLFLVAFFIVTTPAWLMDARTIDGVGVWMKPQKFAVSLALHFFTIAVLAQQLPRRVRAGPTMTIFAYAAMLAMLFEQVYISIQSARGRKSHFNFETEFESLMYALMGIGALFLVFLAAAAAVQIWRRGTRDLKGYRLGSIIGLMIGAITTLAFAGYMSSSGGHWVGAHPAGGAEIPLFGWSREVGDLRPAHFVALHMMQTLPALGYVVDRMGGPGRGVVIGAALLQIAIAAALFAQALSGNPLWPG